MKDLGKAYLCALGDAQNGDLCVISRFAMIRHITISLLALLLSCSLSMANEPIGFQFKKNQRSVTIDIEIVNNLIVIPVILNRILKLKLILDTGVQHTILFNPEVSPLFHVDPHRTVTIMGLGEGEEIEASIATLVEMQIGELNAKNKGLLILPPGSEQDIDKYLGLEVHGLIGFDLFKDAPIRIDYVNHRITAYNPKYWKSKKRGFDKVPLTIRDGKPFFKIDASDKDESCEDCEVLIDSGSALGLTFNTFADKKLSADQPNIEVSMGSGLIGDMTGTMSRVQHFDMGVHKFKNVIASYPEEASLRFLKEKPEQSGSIGAEILSRFICIYDYENAELLIKKTGRVRKPFKFNNTGLQIVAAESDYSKVKIDRVIENSPASDIGLQAGDILLSIQSLNQRNMTLRKALDLLQSVKTGRTIRLLVQRGDDIFHLRLPTRQII